MGAQKNRYILNSKKDKLLSLSFLYHPFSQSLILSSMIFIGRRLLVFFNSCNFNAASLFVKIFYLINSSKIKIIPDTSTLFFEARSLNSLSPVNNRYPVFSAYIHTEDDYRHEIK